MSIDKFIEQAEKEGFFTGMYLRCWVRTAPLDDDVYEHMARHYNQSLAPVITALKEAKELIANLDCRTPLHCPKHEWLTKWNKEFSQ